SFCGNQVPQRLKPVPCASVTAGMNACSTPLTTKVCTGTAVSGVADTKTAQPRAAVPHEHMCHMNIEDWGLHRSQVKLPRSERGRLLKSARSSGRVDYNPETMSRVLAAIVIQMVALACAAQAPGGNSVSPERQMLKLLNMERQRAGLSLFQWNDQLALAAQ